jgi:3-oxoacyl-[acyl-carrier protein] reductase
MSDAFTRRTAIVTGAGHGFGRAIAHAFAREGAVVWACDVNAAGLAEMVATAPGRCEVRTVDVSDRQPVAAFVAEAEGDKGTVDILVNNAGGVRGQVGRPVEEVPEADWQAILAVNLTGAFLCAQAVVPGMKRQHYGRIVNISSGAGLTVSLTGIQAYASAKAGQIGLTRQLAHELGPFGITVNNVAPGFVRSNPTTERQWEAMGEAGQRQLLASIATRRLGLPDDIAHAVLFFAAEASGWITGQTLSVDGGRTYR